MTWTGSVYNLQYDNIGYQMEKLNRESRESLRIFDEGKCVNDIYDWLKEHLEDLYDVDDKVIQKIIKFFKESTYIHDFHIDRLCTENNIEEAKDILYFTKRALENADEYDWIVFLRNNNLEDFDDPCESYLWNAGKCIHQRYFICMYALQVCGEKLLKEKENKELCQTN